MSAVAMAGQEKRTGARYPQGKQDKQGQIHLELDAFTMPCCIWGISDFPQTRYTSSPRGVPIRDGYLCFHWSTQLSLVCADAYMEQRFLRRVS